MNARVTSTRAYALSLLSCPCTVSCKASTPPPSPIGNGDEEMLFPLDQVYKAIQSLKQPSNPPVPQLLTSINMSAIAQRSLGGDASHIKVGAIGYG